MSLTGGCFCGAVRYELSEAPEDARACHCSQCRKAFSGAASAYALVAGKAFNWTAGEDKLTRYEGQHRAGIQFCSVCGSTLCGTFDGEVHGITLGCLDDDADIELKHHQFVGSKAAWDVLPGGSLQFDAAPPTTGSPHAVSREQWFTRPVFFVSSVDESMRFYESMLGCQKSWDYQEGDRTLVAELGRGQDCKIILCEDTDRAGMSRVFIALHDHEMETFRQEIETRQIPVTETWWGYPVLLVLDPDGNQVMFPLDN